MTTYYYSPCPVCITPDPYFTSSVPMCRGHEALLSVEAEEDDFLTFPELHTVQSKFVFNEKLTARDEALVRATVEEVVRDAFEAGEHRGEGCTRSSCMLRGCDCPELPDEDTYVASIDIPALVERVREVIDKEKNK